MDHGQTRELRSGDLPLLGSQNQGLKAQCGEESTPWWNRSLPKAGNYLVCVKHIWLIGPKDQRRRFAFGFFSTNFSPFQ